MPGAENAIGLFTVGPTLAVTSWDDWMADATGRSPTSVQGRRITELYPDLETRGLAARLTETVTEGKVHMLAPAFHGHLIPCPARRPAEATQLMKQRVTIAPLRANDGALTGALITIEDVTPRIDRERELAEKLKSTDERVRIDAVRSLDDADSASLWTSALSDSHWNVRRESVARAAREGAGAVDALLSAMKNNHGDIGLLNSALQVFVALGIDVVEPLAACLTSRDTDLRVYAALALGDQKKDRRAVEALLSSLDDADQNVRFHTIESLGRLRAAEALAPLCAIALTRDFYLAYPALEALAQIGDPAAEPAAIEALADSILQPAALAVLSRVGGVRAAAALASRCLSIGPRETCSALASIHGRLARSPEAADVASEAAGALSSGPVRGILSSLESATESETHAVTLVLTWLAPGDWTRDLATAMESQDVRTRIFAALIDLGRAGARLLERLLNAGDEAVRRGAASALGSVGDPASAPVLIEALDDPSLTIIAAGAIARIGATSAFEPVLKFIGHPDGAVRQAAIAALNSMGHPELERRVLPLLLSSDVALRESAVRIAGYFGYPAAFDAVATLSADPDPKVRRAAIEHLAFFDDPRALSVIGQSAGKSDPVSQTAAMRALAFVTEPGALPLLLAGLRSQDVWTRYYAARSLGRHASSPTVPALTEALFGDSAGHVRAAAAEALGQIGDAAAVKALCTAVLSTDLDVARVAIEALARIRGPQSLAALAQVVRRRESPRALWALQSLGFRGDTDALSVLRESAEDMSDPSLSSAAIAALGQLASPLAVSALLELAAEPRRRTSCIEALGRGDESLVPHVALGLEHGSVPVRTASVEALARMKLPSASDQIGAGLRNSRPEVRLAALKALAALGNKNFKEPVAALARNDDDPAVSAAARRMAAS